MVMSMWFMAFRFSSTSIAVSFCFSPDFRPRASSNASSTGGRLSPIPASEGEWIAFYGPEQLAGSLETTMRLGQHDAAMRLGHHEQTMRLGQEASGFAYPPPPPPYRPPPYNASHHCSLHRQILPCPSCSVTPKHILVIIFVIIEFKCIKP